MANVTQTTPDGGVTIELTPEEARGLTALIGRTNGRRFTSLFSELSHNVEMEWREWNITGTSRDGNTDLPLFSISVKSDDGIW